MQNDADQNKQYAPINIVAPPFAQNQEQNTLVPQSNLQNNQYFHSPGNSYSVMQSNQINSYHPPNTSDYSPNYDPTYAQFSPGQSTYPQFSYNQYSDTFNQDQYQQGAYSLQNQQVQQFPPANYHIQAQQILPNQNQQQVQQSPVIQLIPDHLNDQQIPPDQNQQQLQQSQLIQHQLQIQLSPGHIQAQQIPQQQSPVQLVSNQKKSSSQFTITPELQQEVSTLRASLKNEKILTKMLVSKTPSQMHYLIEAYNSTNARPLHFELQDYYKSDFGVFLEKFCMPLAEFDCDCLRDS